VAEHVCGSSFWKVERAQFMPSLCGVAAVVAVRTFDVEEDGRIGGVAGVLGSDHWWHRISLCDVTSSPAEDAVARCPGAR